GSVLTETLAIARWIEHRDHARRVSFAPGSRESERMWQLMAFLNSGFTGAFTPYWVAMEAQGMPEDARAFLREQGRQAVVERHGKLEAMLDDSPYCGRQADPCRRGIRGRGALGRVPRRHRPGTLSADPRPATPAGAYRSGGALRAGGRGRRAASRRPRHGPDDPVGRGTGGSAPRSLSPAPSPLQAFPRKGAWRAGTVRVGEGGQTHPRAASDTGGPSPTTKWSSRRMSTSDSDCFSRAVTARSAPLGSGFPLGWLWPTITAAALWARA